MKRIVTILTMLALGTYVAGMSTGEETQEHVLGETFSFSCPPVRHVGTVAVRKDDKPICDCFTESSECTENVKFTVANEDGHQEFSFTFVAEKETVYKCTTSENAVTILHIKIKAAQVPKPEVTPSGIGHVTEGENLTLTCSYTGIPIDIATTCKWSKIIPGNDNLIPQIFMYISTQSGCKKRFGNETIYRFDCQGNNVFTLTILNVKTAAWNMTKWICELQIMDTWKRSDAVIMFITAKLAAQFITTPGEVGNIWMNNISINFVEFSTESYLVSTDLTTGKSASEAEENVSRAYLLVGVVAGVAVIGVGIGVCVTVICKRRKHESKTPTQQTRSSATYEQLGFRCEKLYETLKKI